MFDILKLNSISKIAEPILDGYNLVMESSNPLAILVRSTNMADYSVPSSLIAVARAGAGVNNIPCAELAKQGICVFNTPGANANAVKELVLAAMLLSSRNLFDGISWASTLSGDVPKQVEKGKGAFAGTEIIGKTLCVIGLGAIGRLVAIAANALGMNVCGFDPYLSEASKLEIPFATVYNKIEYAYQDADFVSLHMPMTADTRGMISESSIAKMKDGVTIINAARGELVVTADVKIALSSKKIKAYVTDFPDAECIGVNGIIAIPHLGASTEEAEDNCAIMAANELKDYIENGNIRNSVNMPNLSIAKTNKHRTSIISIEGTVLGVGGITATKGGIAYTLINSDNMIDTASIKGNGVLKVRAIY